MCMHAGARCLVCVLRPEDTFGSWILSFHLGGQGLPCFSVLYDCVCVLTCELPSELPFCNKGAGIIDVPHCIWLFTGDGPQAVSTSSCQAILPALFGH